MFSKCRHLRLNKSIDLLNMSGEERKQIPAAATE